MNESFYIKNNTNIIINNSDHEKNYIGLVFVSLVALIVFFSICSFLVIIMKDYRYKGFLCCFIGEFLYFLNDVLTCKPLIQFKIFCTTNIQNNEDEGFFNNLNKKGREFLDYFCINCLKSNRISNIEPSLPITEKSHELRNKFKIKEMFFPNDTIKNELLNEICPICTESIFDNNQNTSHKKKLSVILELKCGHFFHNKCINEWYQKSSYQDCPLCKEEINVEKGYLD